MAVRVRYGTKDVDHPNGEAIDVADGHLFVYRTHQVRRDDAIAVYAPGKWSDATVVESVAGS